MAVAVAHDPHEQATRRRRARISQQAVGDQFPTPISDTAVSDYELGNKPLPFEFTGDDYEVALAKAIVARANRRERRK
jgi:hypothetical protein